MDKKTMLETPALLAAEGTYGRIFSCTACKGRGFFEDYCGIQKRILKTVCLICKGTGRRKT